MKLSQEVSFRNELGKVSIMVCRTHVQMLLHSQTQVTRPHGGMPGTRINLTFRAWALGEVRGIAVGVVMPYMRGLRVSRSVIK